MAQDSYENWPPYLPGPRDDLLALGVVSLNYGYLENIFRVIFSFATELSEFQTRAIFERLNNSARQAVLDQMLAHRTFPPELKALIRYFLQGFTICSTNRHAVMHSHSGGTHHGERGTEGIVLRKVSKSGHASLFFANTRALRAIADDIDRQSQFGIAVFMAMDRFHDSQKPGRSGFELSSLPDRPPLPKSLDWLPAQGIQGAPSSPEPSRA
jgi:hypothetical protein